MIFYHILFLTLTYIFLLLLNDPSLLGAIPGPGAIVLDALVGNVEARDETTELTVLPHDDGVVDLVGIEYPRGLVTGLVLKHGLDVGHHNVADLGTQGQLLLVGPGQVRLGDDAHRLAVLDANNGGDLAVENFIKDGFDGVRRDARLDLILWNHK
eukprot:CAMPEP_0197718222 /NCGR_PEP_ID=MMETSP1434-20131217/2464_1 /TAXON_ID=265543 /ORGANISM="Minutocellus polymorphus, Strain CCMP3303" /LENGTH=154 /DNA_ID=CAMNT_0043302849 /DNA_START=183 /DNA_END=647 /DNA_ORIENTATION=-